MAGIQDILTSGFGLADSLGPEPTLAASSTEPNKQAAPTTAATNNPLSPEQTQQIATAITGSLNAALGAFGLGPNAAAKDAEAKRAAADARNAKMIAGAAVVLGVIIVGVVLWKTRGGAPT